MRTRMIILSLLLAVFMIAFSASTAQAHHSTPAYTATVFDQPPFGEPPMPADVRRRLRQFDRKHAAQTAHWSYTWSQINANLIDTNQDRACGWGANQYCYSDSKRNTFRNWSGDHYVTHDMTWSQYTYCLPGCDYADFCSAVVRTEDHNVGGRVNVVYNWYWTHKESSCVVPTWVVP